LGRKPDRPRIACDRFHYEGAAHGQPSALHRRRTLLQDNDTLRDGRGVVQTRLRTDWSTSVSTPRRPWTWSTSLRMTPTPSSLTPKSFFKSLIRWARAISASENVNSPADWPGMSHSSRIHISSVSPSRCARTRNSCLLCIMVSYPGGDHGPSRPPTWWQKLQAQDLIALAT